MHTFCRVIQLVNYWHALALFSSDLMRFPVHFSLRAARSCFCFISIDPTPPLSLPPLAACCEPDSAPISSMQGVSYTKQGVSYTEQTSFSRHFLLGYRCQFAQHSGLDSKDEEGLEYLSSSGSSSKRGEPLRTLQRAAQTAWRTPSNDYTPPHRVSSTDHTVLAEVEFVSHPPYVPPPTTATLSAPQVPKNRALNVQSLLIARPDSLAPPHIVASHEPTSGVLPREIIENGVSHSTLDQHRVPRSYLQDGDFKLIDMQKRLGRVKTAEVWCQRAWHASSRSSEKLSESLGRESEREIESERERKIDSSRFQPNQHACYDDREYTDTVEVRHHRWKFF